MAVIFLDSVVNHFSFLHQIPAVFVMVILLECNHPGKTAFQHVFFQALLALQCQTVELQLKIWV